MVWILCSWNITMLVQHSLGYSVEWDLWESRACRTSFVVLLPVISSFNCQPDTQLEVVYIRWAWGHVRKRKCHSVVSYSLGTQRPCHHTGQSWTWDLSSAVAFTVVGCVGVLNLRVGTMSSALENPLLRAALWLVAGELVIMSVSPWTHLWAFYELVFSQSPIVYHRRVDSFWFLPLTIGVIKPDVEWAPELGRGPWCLMPWQAVAPPSGLYNWKVSGPWK